MADSKIQEPNTETQTQTAGRAERYDPQAIEQKWFDRWAQNPDLYRAEHAEPVHIAEIILELLELRRGFERDMHAAAFDLDIERLAGADADDALHVGEIVDFLAIDRHHQVARHEAGGLRGAGRLHRIDAGAGGLLADDHEDAGENRDRQDEIRDWSGRHHGGTRADRLVDKADLSLGLVHGGRGRLGRAAEQTAVLPL